MSGNLDIPLMGGFVFGLFLAAFVAGCFRLSAAADRQQERHLADIERHAANSNRPIAHRSGGKRA